MDANEVHALLNIHALANGHGEGLKHIRDAAWEALRRENDAIAEAKAPPKVEAPVEPEGEPLEKPGVPDEAPPPSAPAVGTITVGGNNGS